jgi:hypothetical protein
MANAPTKKTAPKVAAVHEEPTVEVNPVKPGEVKLDDMMHQNWALFAPSHYTKEMVENPRFWTFMAVRFKDLDAVRVTAEDGSWVALGYIRRSISMEVTCQIHDWIELQEAQIAEEIRINDYMIKHFGSVRRFAVVNTLNGTVVKEGFMTQSDALKYATSAIQANSTLAARAKTG